MPPDSEAYHQFTIRVPSSVHEVLIRKLAGFGSLGFIETDDEVIAFFPLECDLPALQRELDIFRSLMVASGQGAGIHIERTSLASADWNAAWKRHFTPLPVGEQFIVIPPWERPVEDRIPLFIDPGMAFGTGHHETTRSCIVLMERFARSVDRSTFLDIGTGTGLLAIAAVKLGFRHCTALDTDPEAVEASLANFRLNNTESVEVHLGELVSISGVFDMIAANLISGTLTRLAAPIKDHLAPSGIAILSGILRGQEEEVLTAAHQAGLRERERLVDGKWVTLAMEHAAA